MTSPQDLLQEFLVVSIPTSLDAALSQRAVQAGKSKAEIVALALEAYLHPQNPSPHAVAQSLQSLQQTLSQQLDRLDRIEREVRQLRPLPTALEPRAASPTPQDLSDEDLPDDEPDEILPEFLEFASPEIRNLSSWS
jgi:seryl-tRNA(Sec) selenium transferase